MSIKNRTIAVVCGLALAATALAPAAAFATLPPNKTVENSNSGTTDVTIQVDKGGQGGQEDQLAFEVPTVIPFAAKADGTLVGPSKDATKIVNKSVFDIHVTGMSVNAVDGWNLVGDASQSSETNALSFELSADPAADPAAESFAESFAGAVSAATPRDLSNDTHWNMSYAGAASSKDKVAIASKGKVANVTKDLHSAQKAATITWTLAAGSAQ